MGTRHHPSRSYKGCAMCKMNKRRGKGRSERDPWSVRKALGKSRRLTRKWLNDG